MFLPMRLVRKQGQPFLLLPIQSRAAALALDLYPAQTPRARIARTLLRLCLKCGLRAGTEKVQLIVRPASPLAQFLFSTLAGSFEPVRPVLPTRGALFAALPIFGLLAGNAASSGQRFLLLVFDRDLKPVAVVKAGTTDKAIELVQQESAFLSAVPAETPGVPKLRGALTLPGISAFALDFFPGHSPGPTEEWAGFQLLCSWIDSSRKVAFTQFADWMRLKNAASASKEFNSVVRALEATPICPALYHGDFAPWNIKVSPRGDWIVLDWERGQLSGIPAWDWFHFCLQPAILVERAPTSVLVERVESLLASDPSKEYFGRADISEIERPLMLAYLHYCVEVIKPSEGLAATRDLLTALQSRWQ